MGASQYTLERWLAGLRKHGFGKKGLLWSRRTAETLFAFELQKSMYGDRYCANVGVWFLLLGECDDCPPRRCHFCGRFGTTAVEEALDFEFEPQRPRVDVVTGFLAEELLPSAALAETALGARQLFESGVLRVPLVLPQARRMLGLAED